MHSGVIREFDDHRIRGTLLALSQARFYGGRAAMSAELIEKKPCNCGAMVLHMRVSDKDYWRCERDPAICGAIGKTYEEALETQLLLFKRLDVVRILH
jgi:hypothetical protein